MKDIQVTLIGCNSYGWKSYNFKKNVPVMVPGKYIGYFLGLAVFSVVPHDEIPKPKSQSNQDEIGSLQDQVAVLKEQIKELASYQLNKESVVDNGSMAEVDEEWSGDEKAIDDGKMIEEEEASVIKKKKVGRKKKKS